MPAPLTALKEPIEHPNWLYELKYDGFRGMLYVDRDRAWLRSIERAMTEPGVNSRLVFLGQALATMLATIVLSIAFICAHDKASYPGMITVLFGGGVGSAFGRFLTKRVGKSE